MSAEPIYYVLVDEPAGPFTREELRAKMEAGELAGATQVNVNGTTEWRRLSELLDSGPVIAVESRPAHATESGRIPYPWLTVDLGLALAFVLGVALAVYYGVFFDPAQKPDLAAALNRRLCGIMGGSALVIVVMLAKVYRVLKTLRSGGFFHEGKG